MLTISPLVDDAGVSIEVFADFDTTGEQMLAQMSVREGIRVNMTLCFSREQAAAVYAATKGSKDPVYVSPFSGRLDDQGQNGMDLVRNIKKMYEAGDGHVHVLAANQLRPIPYKSVDLNLPWESFDIRHEFVYDYKSILKQSA